MHCEETENVMRVKEEQGEIIQTPCSQSSCPQMKLLVEEKNGRRVPLFTSQEIPSSQVTTMISFESGGVIIVGQIFDNKLILKATTNLYATKKFF